ncbi:MULTISPECIES: hypothetical protein [unclassified Achromobacter]|nr:MULTISPECIES: hypothetical protein [unclassified Achromobacter]
MRIPENNRNMLSFPVVTPACRGVAAAMRSEVQPLADGKDIDPLT